jgi:hypothetical protein
VKFLTGGIFLGALAVGADWLICQVTVWGLSLFHVSSGMWGPFFLTSVLAVIIACGVGTGVAISSKST